MHFSSVTDFQEKFPQVTVVGGLEGIFENTKLRDVVMVAYDQHDDLEEHVATPSDDKLNNLFNRAKVVIVRTKDKTIPTARGYTTFSVSIGIESSGTLYTALVQTEEFEKLCSARSCPVVNFSKGLTLTVSSEPVVAQPSIHSIENIDKAELLLALYDNANKQGKEITNPNERNLALLTSAESTGSLSTARHLIQSGQTDFIEIDLGSGARILKVNISQSEVDFTRYEAMHGAGKAAILIADLRKPKTKPKCCVIC